MPILTSVRPVIELAFDPITQVGDLNVRLQTIALAVVILVALLVAARIARRTPVDIGRSPDDIVAPTDPAEDDEPNHLRRDDLLYIVVASLPGAVVFGRLGYWLLHVDYYAANPGAIVDIGQGGFQLSLAVIGGVLSASVVASLLGAPVGRWLHAAIVPLLFAIAGGKLAMALGGDGQGLPWDGALATAYTGPGPWLSLAPEVPSHPSQVYEALATVVVIATLLAMLAGGAFRRRTGGVFLLGLAMWAVARLFVAFTWRDPLVLGPLRMDQVLSVGIALVALVLLTVQVLRGRSGEAVWVRGDGEADRPANASTARPRVDGEPDWPDPTTRPRI
ncbi:MAG: prolipoprotein diacylglyceryl transferase family protein [Candidatus Limnocylindrales bacterium]